MSDPSDKTARLAAALKANLARRKAQTRARRDAPPAGEPVVTAPDTTRSGSDTPQDSEPEIVPGGKAR